MRIKSLLIGSAAAAVMTTGAQAADAIIFPDPEPVEYVRVCDVYGAGFFYIPGTETCLRVGGQVRFEVNTSTPFTGPSYNGVAANGVPYVANIAGGPGFRTLARFEANFDARTATEWGTLRSFASIISDANTPGAPSLSALTVLSAFIDVGDNNFLRFGRNWSPYTTWVRGGAGLYAGGFQLAPNWGNQITYYFNTGNHYTTAPQLPGFGGFISAIERTQNTIPGFGVTTNGSTVDVEAGIGYGWQGGWIRAAAHYDAWAPTAGFGVDANGAFTPAVASGSVLTGKIGIAHTFGGLNLQLTSYHTDPSRLSQYAFGASGATFAVPGFATARSGASWSLLGSAAFQVTPTVNIHATAQWFNQTVYTTPASLNWVATVGATFTPFGSNLQIIPEVQYLRRYDGVVGLASAPGFNGGDAWNGGLRINRNF